MSTFIWMKILESSPARYDRGIRLLTLGTVGKTYDLMTAGVKEGEQVLDIGCGTGALTLRAARKGARVVGMDINPAMLDIAGKNAAAERLEERITLKEMGAAELDGEEENHYDRVLCGLCLSELSDGEIDFALRHIFRILKPGGWFQVADEIKPKGFFRLVLYRLIRFPLRLLTALLIQTTTRPVKDLAARILGTGFQLTSIHTNFLGSFMSIEVKKPQRGML
jgi:ubiquinone/menaquinone biosynthesis C-methylase UbiE